MSSPQQVYSFDTSALIDGLERFYPPANFPALWDRVSDLVAQRRLLISEEVHLEAQSVDAPLKVWCSALDQEVIVATDAEVARIVGEITAAYPSWAGSGRKNRADPFVIAVAEMHSGIVVTGEKPGGPSNPKIPYVCGARNIVCVRFIDVIRREGWTF